MPTQPGKVTRFVDVDIVITGPIGFRIDGFDAGTSITLAPQGDRNTVVQGNDGIDAFAETASRYEIWTMSVLQTSDSNDKMSTWLEAGITQGIACSDRSGRTRMSSGAVRIRQRATSTWSAGVESRSWDLQCIGVVGIVGGQNDPPA